MRRHETGRSKSLRGRGIAVLALAAALAVPTALLADPGHRDRPGRPDGPRPPRLMHALHGLELAADQRGAIIELLEAARPGMEAAHEAVRAVRNELRTAIHAVPFDEGAMRDAAARLSEVEIDVALGRVETLRLVREQLTEEQRAALQQRLDEAPAAEGRSRGSHRRGGRGPRNDRFGS